MIYVIHALSSLLALAVLVYGGRSLYRRVLRPLVLKARYRREIEGIGRYKVGKCLGLGCQGILYEVEESNRVAVLKVIYAPQKHNDRFLARLRSLSEAIVKAGLDQSGITFKVHEIGELRSSGRSIPYQLLEKIEGKTLKQRIEAGHLKGMPLCDRVGLLDRLLACVQEVETAGLHFVHIDPDNVMLDEKGRTRLIDLEAFKVGGLGKQKRARYYRRICRTILATLGDGWEKGTPNEKRQHAESFNQWLMAHHTVSWPPDAPFADVFKPIETIRRTLADIVAQ